MIKHLEKILLKQVFLIVFLVSIGYIIGSISAIQAVQKSSGEPSYNLSCPKPNINIENQDLNEKDELRTDTRTRNYIQSPEANVNYKERGDLVEVEIDALTKPEGMSMRPSIFSGNTLLLDKYDGKDLESGQIIRYSSSEGGHIVHRVRASYIETGGYVLVKGDNTDSQDRVEKEDITHIVHGILYT